MEMVNEALLPGNVCFGCGHQNAAGLRIEIRRDPAAPARLVGTFDPPGHMIGFPGITHGGAIYTALDCIAAWTPTALRTDVKAIWILRQATIEYLRPAAQGRRLFLSAEIERDGQGLEPVVVRAQARDEAGALLAEGTFKVVPLPARKFKQVAGIERLPDNWSRLLGEAPA